MIINIEDLEILDVPKIHDPRGTLAVIENDVVPFEIKRVYYLFDVPSGSHRGGHAHKGLSQFLIALSGSFDVLVKDASKEKRITLNNPAKGLLITPCIWRELENFSSGAVCLVVASEVYKEEDYISDFTDYLLYLSEQKV
ncbi:WxcM-like domain-containing protein [Algibacter amylolyticus]|uniref:WxcM-like domain-containing protein n=1 Tax=Algibacter amylolyticus TaxID=1608400 RepID=A0A5M7B5M0_9FLAO|nr:FdtA/QdtA family cupin domain-containing protein [Algibacter amylolyticus]KAA5824050.1 WxcM-like domain-containing protein [Algibacter amylolyticus]MBB5269603.1 dTDP-4-dehydrorhamnose 3,5-epimerase-like enzyme [Algibacter amylolyticus]TSJ74527.1 WxcM-like domain-containing protein [Algibacter amylolyticus]